MHRVVRLALLVIVLLTLGQVFGQRPAQAAVSGYKLPWPAGRQALMTGGPGSHRNGEAALDFDIEGGLAVGQVLAAKGGQVVFRKDSSSYRCESESCWRYANLVVIQHASNEFSWYLHLEQNSIPAALQVGSTVAQGALIGREGNTGYTVGRTGIHLHFAVSTTFGGVSGSGDTRMPAWPTTFQAVDFDEYPWSVIQQTGWRTSQNTGGTSPCPAPTLTSPSAGQVLTDRRVSFSWQPLGCGQGYTLRIKDVSSMDSGGSTIYDMGHGETSRVVEIPAEWLNRDLYWGVRAANAPGAAWRVQQFRLISNAPSPGGNACIPNVDQVALYEHADFVGRCTTIGIGAYRDPAGMGFDHDIASSVRVGAGVRVTFYEHPDYGGGSETLAGDDPNLSNNSIGNDTISSARVERRASADPCPAPVAVGPLNGTTVTSADLTFSWNAPSGCTFQGYTFRLKDTPNMEQGGTVLVDTGVGGTSYRFSLPQEWHGRELYWGVRTANPLSPAWAIQRFWVRPPNTGETDPQSIESGQSRDGRIDPASEDDTFTFSGSAGQRVTITMERTDASSLDSYVELFGPGGLVGYNDDSNGTLNSRLVLTLPQAGVYRILARSYVRASSGAYRLGLTLESTNESGVDGDDGRWLRLGESLRGTISPSSDRDTYYFSAAAGRTVSLRMNKSAPGLDSYIELYNANGTRLAENDDSGGDLNSWLVVNLPAEGVYRVVARSFAAASGGDYTLQLEAMSGRNLARDKTAFASSVEGNRSTLAAGRVTDGDGTTRWSSAFSDNQWIYVDLGSNQTLNQVVLRWERAFADRYAIFVRDASESSWRQVYSTASGDGNVDTISFTPTTARYVMMQGRHRFAHGGWQQWGYSLWEFEVYNTLAVLVPTVPPDSTDKGDEGLAPLVPLPPDPAGKDPGQQSQGSEQENMPQPDAATGQAPQVEPGVVYGPPQTGLTLSHDRAVRGVDTVTLTAIDAGDSDEAGDGIVAYAWSSSLDGALGSTASLTLPTAALSVGIHTIELRVQDNEGSWSEPAIATLEVLHAGYTVYLPITRR